jgi:hypothetical protein
MEQGSRSAAGVGAMTSTVELPTRSDGMSRCVRRHCGTHTNQESESQPIIRMLDAILSDILGSIAEED